LPPRPPTNPTYSFNPPGNQSARSAELHDFRTPKRKNCPPHRSAAEIKCRDSNSKIAAPSGRSARHIQPRKVAAMNLADTPQTRILCFLHLRASSNLPRGCLSPPPAGQVSRFNSREAWLQASLPSSSVNTLTPAALSGQMCRLDGIGIPAISMQSVPKVGTHPGAKAHLLELPPIGVPVEEDEVAARGNLPL